MNDFKKFAVPLFSAGILFLALVGCDRSEAPAKTEADVSKALVEGQKNVEKERHDAAEKTMDAQKDVNKASTDLAHEAAEGHRAVTVAQAQSDHDVSIQKCEAMTGDARADCKKQADANLEQAKMQADTNEHAMDPKR